MSQLTLKALNEKIESIERVVSSLKEIMETTVECSKDSKSKKILINNNTFELLGLKWTVLERTESGYICLADCLKDKMQFDEEGSDWKSSELREYLNNEFYSKLAEKIGAENIISMERDLLSLDGQTEYGKCVDNVSLISVDEYRNYRSLIPNTDDNWWWLITPWSTPCNDYKTWCTVVSPCVLNINCFISRGVRPFVSFSSAIFESEE